MMDGEIRLITDTDPRQDDAVVTLVAHGSVKHGLIDFIALTAVAGDVGLNYTSANAWITCDWTGWKDPPVYADAGKLLLRDLAIAEEVHGKTGSDDVALHDPECPLQSIHVVDYLVRVLRGAKRGSIILCPIGPLTNIAPVFNLTSGIVSVARSIVLMGGCCFEAGNITPCAEFNFHADPYAAQVVLQGGASITTLSLDVIHKARITTLCINILRRPGNVNDLRLTDAPRSYEWYDIQAFEPEDGPLHDSYAVVFIVFPGFSRGKACHADVDMQSELSLGTCSVSWRGTTGRSTNAFWVTEIDSGGLFRELAGSVSFPP